MEVFHLWKTMDLQLLNNYFWASAIANSILSCPQNNLLLTWNEGAPKIPFVKAFCVLSTNLSFIFWSDVAFLNSAKSILISFNKEFNIFSSSKFKPSFQQPSNNLLI